MKIIKKFKLEAYDKKEIFSVRIFGIKVTFQKLKQAENQINNLDEEIREMTQRLSDEKDETLLDFYYDQMHQTEKKFKLPVSVNPTPN